ncbi:MAG TPA: AAA family ATPase [Rhodothermales bacterium]|nr:AAA family ATPase [Rhodothermales bacterium]
MSRFSGGLVVGKFAPLHRGHERLIAAALAQCRRVVVMVWSDPDFEAMPTAVRATWLRERFPEVTVLAFNVGEAPPNAAPDDAHRAFIRAHLPFPVEAVFTGGEAYGEGLGRALGAVHVAVDRRADGRSGRAARADVGGYHEHLVPGARAHFVERVVFLGAESSGKSTLAQAVAARLGEPYVEEVGRTLWVEAGGDLPLADYVRICREHVALEDAAARQARRWVLVDTNALTTQAYAFFFFGACPPEVQAYAARCRERYRHVFVCAPDFPFVQDGTRVHPQVQRYMDGAIRNDLTVRGIPYTVVGGTVAERVGRVLAALGVAAGS